MAKSRIHKRLQSALAHGKRLGNLFRFDKQEGEEKAWEASGPAQVEDRWLLPDTGLSEAGVKREVLQHLILQPQLLPKSLPQISVQAQADGRGVLVQLRYFATKRIPPISGAVEA